MLKPLALKFSMQPIIDQVLAMDLSSKRIDLNKPNGKYFNDPWENMIKGTPLGDVLDGLGNIGQARLLCLESGDTYTAHTDPDDRYHLAITTNEFSYLIDVSEQKFYHLPVDGTVWQMDTSPTHVAVNWGPTTRVHLNVRVLLPHYSVDRKGVKITVSSDMYNWKQNSYIEIMGFINKAVKSGVITGFDTPNSQTLYLNCEEPRILDPFFEKIRSSGVDITLQYQ